MPSGLPAEVMGREAGPRCGPNPNSANGGPLRGSAATFLKDKGEQKNRESADSCGRMGLDFSPMVFETWGGLHGAGKDLVKAIFARCTASLLPGAQPAASGALRQGLSVQLGRSVARQLEALMMLSTVDISGDDRVMQEVGLRG